MKVTDIVRAIAEPIVAAQGCTIWDVEFVREGAERFLRLYVDKDGGVDICDCKAISRAMDPVLDEADPIPESYNFEVCSAGIERVLKRPGDFEKFLSSKVLVKLYAPEDGAKEFVGELLGFDDGAVTIRAGGTERRFEKQQVALTRLYAEF